MSTLNRYPQRDATYNVTPETVAIVDRYQSRVVALDGMGCHVWLRIDGETTVYEIAADIARETGQPMQSAERDALTMIIMLLAEGLIYLELEPIRQPYHVSLPEEDQDVEKAAASRREAGWNNDRARL